MHLARAIAALITLALAPHVASAGAWMREQKTAYAAVSATVRKAASIYEYETAFYAEYGALNWLTIGLDVNELNGRSGHALAFVRFPLAPKHWRHRFALEVAVGGHRRGLKWDQMEKITLSYGRSITSGFGDGWISADAALERRAGGIADLYKLDITAGLTAERRLRPAFQIETAKARSSPLFWSVTPALTYRNRKGTVWFAGIQRRSTTTDMIGVKVALWRTF